MDKNIMVLPAIKSEVRSSFGHWCLLLCFDEIVYLTFDVDVLLDLDQI